MAAAVSYKIILCIVCTAAFIKFCLAARMHFVDTKERPLGMLLIFSLTPLGTLATLATYVFAEISLIELAAALSLYAASLVLFQRAALTTSAEKRLSIVFSSDSPKFLVRSGPYRFIRHPFYASYLLFWLAGVSATGAWWLAALFVGMTALYVMAAKAEEKKFSSSSLADDYAAYAERTWMFLPGAL